MTPYWDINPYDEITIALRLFLADRYLDFFLLVPKIRSCYFYSNYRPIIFKARLKPLLQPSIPKPEFYEDLVYKFPKTIIRSEYEEQADSSLSVPKLGTNING